MSDPILKAIADNPALMEAVKKVIVDKFSVDILNPDTTHDTLIDQVRARILALQKINEAFTDIAKHKSTPERPPARNEAR